MSIHLWNRVNIYFIQTSYENIIKMEFGMKNILDEWIKLLYFNYHYDNMHINQTWLWPKHTNDYLHADLGNKSITNILIMTIIINIIINTKITISLSSFRYLCTLFQEGSPSSKLFGKFDNRSKILSSWCIKVKIKFHVFYYPLVVLTTTRNKRKTYKKIISGNVKCCE